MECSLLPSPFDHFLFALIHGPNIPNSYTMLLFPAWDLTSILSHIHSGVLFLLWLHLFILSGAISSLISSSILGTYWPGELIFQFPIFLTFDTVHGVLRAGILKWFAVFFSNGPHFVRTLHHDPSVFPGPTSMAHSFIELDRQCSMWSDWLLFCDCDYQSVCPLMGKGKRLMETSW